MVPEVKAEMMAEYDEAFPVGLFGFAIVPNIVTG